jgi:ABC-2 type transport system permease protein
MSAKIETRVLTRRPTMGHTILAYADDGLSDAAAGAADSRTMGRRDISTDRVHRHVHLYICGAIAGNVHNYLPLIIPGLLVMTAVTTSIQTGVQLREDMDTGVFDRFKSLPIARIAPLAGALLADTVRYVIATVLTLAMGYLMGYRPAGGIGAVALAALLVIVSAWAVSWIFAFFGVVARTAASVQGLSMVILFPLTFLSNAFVPAKTLPVALQDFVKVNPISHLVTAVRALANTGQATSNLVISLIGAAVLVLVFAPLTVRAYMRKA